MIKLLIFDVGGTLLDHHPGMRKIDANVLMEVFNVRAEENDIQNIIDSIDLKYANSYRLKTPFSEIISKAILKKYGIPVSNYKKFIRKVNMIIDSGGIKPYPDVVPTIKKLKTKYYIATLANVYRSRQSHMTLRKNKLEKHFHFLIDSDSAGIRKPDSRIFKKVLQYFKVEPYEVVMVGDAPVQDIWGAKRLGIHTVLINRRKLPYRFSERTRPDFEIKSFYQLLSILKKIK